MGFDGLNDLVAQLMLLQKVAQGQDGRLIRDPVTDQLDTGKVAHGRDLDQASSIAGSLSEYRCSRRWTRSSVASG